MLTFFTPFSRLSLLELEVRKPQILRSYTLILKCSLRWLRGVQIRLGVLSIILSGFVLAFPGFAFLSLIIILAAIAIIAFMAVSMVFNGCARIVEGIRGRHPRWTKALLIGAGILSLILGGLVMVYPLLGVVVAATFLAIGLMFSGIKMTAAGVMGRPSEVPSANIAFSSW